MIDTLVSTINQSWKFIVAKRKTILSFALFFVIAGVIWHGTGGTATAAADDPSSSIFSVDFWLGLFVRILLALARLCLSLTVFILTFIIQLAGYNGYLDSQAVTVGWVMVRDMTNMGFVVILLAIAFGTILGSENYEWKKMLVKLVLAAVLVNFSRTICGLIIDVAQVVMNTFVNGIAATASGNLIRMFNLDSIRSLSATNGSDAFNNGNFFLAAVMALVFSAIVLFTIGIFLMMLLARMVILWTLIVLSPLAFVLSVLPQTVKYSERWWSEFTANVITGPALLFFLWLAFVTVGNGRINEDIADPAHNITGAADGTEADLLAGKSSGIGKAMDWNNMANFAIAIGMLIVGSKVAAELGGMGGDWAGNAVEFGKKVGMYAGGIMAARWATENVAKPTAKFAAMKIPLVGGDKWVNLGTRIAGGAKLRYYQFQEGRNNLAKDIGETNKKFRELKIKRDNKEISEGQYQQDLAAMRKDNGLGKRLLTGLGEKFIETNDRAFKKADDFMKAAEAQHEAYMGDFSTSSYKGGRRKYQFGIKAEFVEERGHAKTEDKKALIRAGMYKEATELAHGAQGKGEMTQQLLAAEKAGDTDQVNALQKEIAKKTKAADKLKGSLVYSTVGAKVREHAHAGIQGTEAKKTEVVFGHGKTGEDLHKKAAQAELETKTFQLDLDTHMAQLKLAQLMGKVGTEYIKSQAGYDAQTGAETAARQQMLSDLREERAIQAQKTINDLENRVITEKAKDGSEIRRKLTDEEISQKIAELSKTKAEIASAFFGALKKENEMLEQKSRGLLEEDVMQRVIGSRQNIDFPTEASRKAIEAARNEFKGIDKESLLDAAISRMNGIAEKRERDGKDGYKYSDKEQRRDQLWTQAIATQLQIDRYFDDLAGKGEAVVKRVEEFKAASQRSGMEASINAARRMAASVGAPTVVSGPRVESLRGTDLDGLKTALKDLVKQNIGQTNDLKSLIQHIVRENSSPRDQIDFVGEASRQWAASGAAGRAGMDQSTMNNYLLQIVQAVHANNGSFDGLKSEIASLINEIKA